MKNILETLSTLDTYLQSNAGTVLPLFFVVFILWGCLVFFLLARLGWSKLAYKYESEPPSDIKKIGIYSAKIGPISYSNSFTLSYNEHGIFLKPLLLFRVGHKALFLPFRDIASVEHDKVLFQKVIVLKYKDENLPAVTFELKKWNKILELSGYNPN